MIQGIQHIKHELMKKEVGTTISLELKEYTEAGMNILCDHLLDKENIKATYIKLDEVIKVFCKY